MLAFGSSCCLFIGGVFAFLLVLLWPFAVQCVCFHSRQMSIVYFWFSCIILGVGNLQDGKCCKGWVHWYGTTFCQCCLALDCGEIEAQAGYCTAHQLHLVLYCNVLRSIWFHSLVFFMYGFWLWLLFLLLIDLFLPFFVFSYLPVYLLICCMEQCLSSFFVWLVPGLWQVSVMWLFLFCVSGCDLGLIMVRGHMGSPLWPMASPWNNLTGVDTSWHMLSSPLEFNLDLSLPHSTSLIMRLECSLFMVSTVATAFWIVSYVSNFFILESCTMCLLVSLLGLDCLVWRLVASLMCAFCSYPGSDYGFLFPLIYCWMDVCSFGLWPLFWFSVTSSFELWQPKPKAFLPMACDVMVCVACCSEANAVNLCWSPGLCILFSAL